MRRHWIAAPAAVLAAGLGVAALAQDERHDVEGGASIVRTADLAWFDPKIPGFDPGMEMAIVHGDPSVPDEPYVFRLSFPDGYRFPAHWHPKVENVTVLEGTFMLGMGERRDEARMKEYHPGDFLSIPPRHPHFGAVRGFTVVQLHGPGPFQVFLVDQEAATQHEERH